MADTYVVFYPPTTGHPYLVVTFLADQSPGATPFDSEEEAEAFIERDAPQMPSWGWWIEDGRAVYLSMPGNRLNVQHVFEDDAPDSGDDRAYVGVRCLACSGIHLATRTTGRLATEASE